MLLTKKFILAFTCAVVAYSASAMELTVLSTGSKTGSFSIESSAYAQDLSKNHKVKYLAPGNHCAAFAILQQTKTPILFPWATDFESVGRDGEGCATVSFKPEQIVRFNTDPMYACSLKPNLDAKTFITKGTGFKVGHTTVEFVFARTVLAVNKSFGTIHKPVVYNGQGMVKTALYNGEVDYALFSAKFVKDVVANGGTCHYVMSNQDRLGYPAIGKLDPSNQFLNGGYATVWLMFNVDAGTVQSIKKELQKNHHNADSAIVKATSDTLVIDWEQSPKSIIDSWETNVSNMRR